MTTRVGSLQKPIRTYPNYLRQVIEVPKYKNDSDYDLKLYLKKVAHGANAPSNLAVCSSYSKPAE